MKVLACAIFVTRDSAVSSSLRSSLNLTCHVAVPELRVGGKE